jgi:hypothetical protein
LKRIIDEVDKYYKSIKPAKNAEAKK